MESRIWSIERCHFQFNPRVMVRVKVRVRKRYETVPKLSNGTTFNDLE